MLFIYWTVGCCALCLIVYINASLLPSRKLSAEQDKKCPHLAEKNEIGLSRQRNSGDDGVSRQCDDVKKCLQLPGAGQVSSTVIRKQFHVAAVAMFVPGLLMDVNLLYVAASCALVVLIMLEVGSDETSVCIQLPTSAVNMALPACCCAPCCGMTAADHQLASCVAID